MKRRVALGMLVLLVPLLTVGPAAARPEAQAAGEGRIVVVLLNGTSLQDWLSADTFHLRRAIREGSPGLLSARTGARPPGDEAGCLARPSHALATLVNGTRSTADDLADPTPLRIALRRAGASLRVIEAPLVRDSSFPTGRRTDQARLSQQFRSTSERVVVIDVPDSLYADCAGGRQRDRWVGVAIGRADATIGAVRATLGEGDRLIVLSAVPPWHREDTRNYLTAVTLEDPVRDSNTILTSPTTRRRGVVSLTDVASTIVAQAGIDATVGIGRAWRTEPGGLDFLQRAERDFTHAAAIRLPVMRGYIWLSVGILIVAGIVVLAGRGRARGGRLPRTGRDWLATGAAAIAAAPAAMLIEPLTNASTLPASVAVIAGVAITLAIGVGSVRGVAGAVPVCAALSATGLIAFVGEGELGARSALSYSIAGGDRFFGVGNEMMGVAIAGSVIALASLLDRHPGALKWIPPVLLVIAASMAAPVAGAKFGATFVAVPSFGVFIVRASGRRVPASAAIAIAIVTTMIAGIFAAWDLLGDPQSQSHVARVVADDGTLARKIGAALRLAGGSYWTAGIAIATLAAYLFGRRRTTLTARATWSRPALRAALLACAVAALAALAFNDAGIVAASLIGLFATAALMSSLLVGQSPPLPERPSVGRLKQFAR